MAGLTEGQHIPNTIPFQGSNVYLLTDLITFDRPFFVGCIKSQRSVIRKKNIPAHQYWFATHSKRTNTWALAIPENCKAKILISEEWVHNNLPRLTGNQDAYKYKPLPPLLELNEDEKFRDIEDNVHEVEVRGVRSREGIRFSCRDVARVFEMETLDTHINRMLDSSDYEVFCSDGPANWAGPSEQNMAAYQASTYITYNGLLKIIFASRSGVAYLFQDWAGIIKFVSPRRYKFYFIN
jgi:hypothetical protein